jgi:hypothetical protein
MSGNPPPPPPPPPIILGKEILFSDVRPSGTASATPFWSGKTSSQPPSRKFRPWVRISHGPYCGQIDLTPSRNTPNARIFYLTSGFEHLLFWKVSNVEFKFQVKQLCFRNVSKLAIFRNRKCGKNLNSRVSRLVYCTTVCHLSKVHISK